MTCSFLAVVDPGYQAGVVMGCLLAIGLPLAGTIATCAAMRHSEVSRKALLGLALTLAACTGLMAIGAVGELKTEGVAMAVTGSPVTMVLVGVAAVFSILLMVAGAVMATLGVIDTYRRPERFRRGRRRGFLGLTLAVLFFGVFFVGLIVRLARGSSAAGAVAQTVTVDEANYRITRPAAWSVTDPKRFGPQASFAAVSGNPQIFTLVVADRPAAPLSLEAAAEAMKRGVPGDRPPEWMQRRETVNGYEGLLIETEVVVNGSPMFSTTWVTMHAGDIYKIVSWGDAPRREQVREGNAQFRRSFQIIDPQRAARLVAAQADEQYHSSSYGWSIDLKGTWWTRRWPTLATDVPGAEWGIANPEGTACFCVIPVWIGKDEAPLDALTHGLAAQVAIRFPSDTIYGVKEAVTKGEPTLKGQSFAWDGRRESTEFVYRLRVLQGEYCSYLLAAWQVRGRNERVDLLDEALDRVRFDPKSPMHPRLDRLGAAEQRTHRIVFNDIGVGEESAHHLAKASEWCKRAYELGRDDATALLNYVSMAQTEGKAEEAQKYLSAELGRFPGNAKLAAAAANLQMAAGDVKGGLLRYTDLFASGFRDDALFSNYLNAACENGEGESAAKALDRYAEGHDSPRLRKLRALLAQARGDFPGALAILEALRKENPEDADTLSALSDCHFIAKQYPECIAICDRLLELKRDSAGVYRRKGLAEFALKRYPEAKEAMELAIRRDPADPEVKRLLDYLAGVLGQGANFAVKTPIPAVPLPEEFPAPEAKSNDPYLRGFSACYRQCVESIAYDPDQEHRTTEREVITVFDQQGVEEFSTLEVAFDPLAEEVYVNSVTVKDSANQPVATAKIEDSYVVDEGGGAQVATQRKVLHIPVPGLQPGSTLETTITRRETGAVKSFDFHSRSLSMGLPVLRSILVLSAPEGAVKWEGTPGLAPAKWKGGLRWTVERPIVFRLEPQLDTLDKILPMVWLADAHANWPAEAKEYLATIKDRLVIDPAVKDAAAEAVKGKTSRAEKIAALARFTQNRLTYKAVEFGRRARMPNPAEQTLTHRYGDCKDHALLLSQLLEASGIPAQLALVSFGTPIRAGLPSLDQFDHMIVYVPEGKGGRFLDCTGKSSDLASDGPPQGLATQSALILDATHPRLETIPDYPAGSSGVSTEREITMSPSGADLTVQETVIFSGLMGASMRETLKAIQPAERQRRLLEMLNAQIPGLDLLEAVIDPLDELQSPLRLRLRYLLRERCQIVGDRLVGRLGAPWEHMLLAATPLEKRTLPFRIQIPTSFECRVHITPPVGWSPAMPEKRRIEKPFCTASMEARLDQSALRLEAHLTRHPGAFPADKYKAYVDTMTEAIALTERSLVFKKQ